MNCAEFESILADYIDGTLPDAERHALEEHVAGCAGCRELMRDVTGGLGILRQADSIEPPAELITRIAYLAPMGRTREPFETQSVLSRFLNKWLMPLVQPRFAMGMAMTILSFAMLKRCTGVEVHQIQPSDLNPVRVWGGMEDKALRVRDQVAKYYENLRIVYEIESHLKDLEEPQNGRRVTRRAANNSSPKHQNNGSGTSQQPRESKP